jgi:hypothetical protein
MGIVGSLLFVLISFVGVRFFSYFHSFFVHWPRYRQRAQVTTKDVTSAKPPFVKIQITTRGSPGTTSVITRGIQAVVDLANEAPRLYAPLISVEVVTESEQQAKDLACHFAQAPIPVAAYVLPKEYETARGTKLKARALHYMVELRRNGLNRKPGKTFIVHYDEESVITPNELKRLLVHLASTAKRLMEGPIYYPLEYKQTSVLCQAMEANRPIGCFECRAVMEHGVPFHLHGSNLVIDEALENELGWDIGNLDGQPFIAEDFVFGMLAYLHYGRAVFGWHGCVMLEQPPFSVKSAFRQRYRWVVGVLQGLTQIARMQEFQSLPGLLRHGLMWGTGYRVATFALGLPVGVLSLLYILYLFLLMVRGRRVRPPAWYVSAWLLLIGFLWLNSIFIGAWYNVSSSELSRLERVLAVAQVLAVAPVAGIVESAAAFWAVLQWLRGERKVVWTTTPKTKQADRAT